MHMHAGMHNKPKCVRNFQKFSVAILKLFLNENDKTVATLQIGFCRDKPFSSVASVLLFSVRKSLKMAAEDI